MAETEVRNVAPFGTMSSLRRPSWSCARCFNGRMAASGVVVVLFAFLMVWAYQRQKAINALDASGISMWRMVPGSGWFGDDWSGPWRERMEHSGWLPGTHLVSWVGPPSRTVTQDAVEALVHLQNAERLWLDRCGLTDEQLAMIAQVEVIKILDIEANPITDKGLRHLTALPSLEYLNVVDTNVTPAAVERFRRLMPQCEVVAVRKPESVDSQPVNDEMRIICY